MALEGFGRISFRGTITYWIRVVLNAINIVGAMTFVSTPNVDLLRDGLAGAG